MSKKTVEAMDRLLKEFPAIAELIQNERIRQINKWGDDAHNYDKFCRIMGEEFGEICRAVEDHDLDNVVDECVQVAAVCVRMIQCIQREIDAIHTYGTSEVFPDDADIPF
jgi:NTP pyrophosphatase (non-canonical NTP hydrolase)